jgi:hypothetical protein
MSRETETISSISPVSGSRSARLVVSNQICAPSLRRAR